MRLWVLAGGLLAGLAACGGGGVEGKLDMALSCQLKSCLCVSETSAVFFAHKTKPVLWRQNGDAYCEQGFELEFGEEKKRR